MIDDYLTSIRKAVSNVFSLMAHIDPRALPVENKTHTKTMGEVTGVIEIKGRKMRGSAAVSFSRELILALSHRMLHLDVSELDESVQDLAREMTNMVIGSAKSEMDDKGYSAEMSIPAVIVGKGRDVRHCASARTVLAPFESSEGDFWIEICLEQ